jgi:hypothetical protein
MPTSFAASELCGVYSISSHDPKVVVSQQIRDRHHRPVARRPSHFLMDGGDLSAVLEDRVSLPELLTRKRQHASRKGAVFISACDIIGG